MFLGRRFCPSKAPEALDRCPQNSASCLPATCEKRFDMETAISQVPCNGCTLFAKEMPSVRYSELVRGGGHAFANTAASSALRARSPSASTPPMRPAGGSKNSTF
jgi:hypothetical protein